MHKLLNFLAKRNVVLICLVLIFLINIGFQQVLSLIGGQPLDLLMSAAEAKLRLAEMSGAQKQTHIWVTWTLDALYPLAYGGFFVGLTARFSKRFRPLRPTTLAWFTVPAFVSVIADFIENSIQTMALLGSDQLLGLKDILTPLKFISVGIAAFIAISFLVLAAIKKFTKKT